MDDMLSLGTEVANWQIKDFSVALRQQITQAARRQDCTVAEWLHGYFQRHGIDGQQFEPVKLAAVGPDPAMNGSAPAHGAGSSIDDLCKLTEAAARFAEAKDRLPPKLAGRLATRLREALRTPETAPRPRPRMIAAPEEDNAA